MNTSSTFSNLIIRVPNWLGDTMMAVPAVTAVIDLFRESRVTILTKPDYGEFWANFRGVDKVISFKKEKGFFYGWEMVSELEKKKFDAALILPTSFSSAFLPFAAGIPVRIGWGAEGRDCFLTHVVPRPMFRQKHLVWEYLSLVQEGFDRKLPSQTYRLASPITRSAKAEAWKLGVRGKKGWIALSPGATYGPAKRWPLPYWKTLIEKLFRARAESILVLGGKEEERNLEELRTEFSTERRKRVHWLVGKTSLLTLAAVLKRCKILVTNDTGPMHVAAAVGTPTVALFGSTTPAWTRPFGRGHEVFYHHVECSPCFQKTCPIGYVCLHEISMEEVFQTVQRRLENPLKIQGEKPLHGDFS